MKRTFILLFVLLIIFASACANTQKLGGSFPTATPTPIFSATPPFILFSGVKTFEVSWPEDAGNTEVDLLKSSFDFDSNKTDPWNLETNDIRFGMSIPYAFLAVGPTFGASERSLSFGQSDFTTASEVFNYYDCYNRVNDFAHGTDGIPSVGTYYCLLTNEGRLVEYVIENITELGVNPPSYSIEIKYVVWNTIIRK